MNILYLPNEYSQQRQREKPACIYPILMAMEATWHKQQGDTIFWHSKKPKDENRLMVIDLQATKFQLDMNDEDKTIYAPEGIDFLKLPAADRVLTHAIDYAFDNGNFKYTPGTYIMAAKGCWHGQCTFCVEKGSHYQIRATESVIEEIGDCIKLGYKEIFDDSGTFPTGAWCLRFCQAMIAKGYNKQVRLGCNMRLDYLHPNLKGMQLMRQAGFRMVLYGLESANQPTLDRIHKGINITSAITRIKVCAKAGLEPHIAVMFGYPWENDKDAIATLRLVHYLLKHGYAKTAQASFYNPGCNEIDTHPENYGSNLSHKKYVKQIYNVAYSPLFWFNKIKDIKNVYDLKYLWRSIKKGVGL